VSEAKPQSKIAPTPLSFVALPGLKAGERIQLPSFSGSDPCTAISQAFDYTEPLACLIPAATSAENGVGMKPD
jgi:hypothetical protein